MRFQDSMDVDAPAERVFTVFADVERWPEWTSTVTRVDVLTPGSMSVGTRAEVHQPRLPVATWEVTELAPGRSFTWVARSPGLRTTGRHEVLPRDGGGCTARATIDQEGLLAPVVGLLAGRLTRSYLATEVRSIKQRCESSADS